MELRQVRLSDPVVAPLLDGLTAEYDTRYGWTGEMVTVEPHEFDPPAGLFVVLVDGDAVVAGGGFRALAPGVCEVKRMWTASDRRREGHATTVLQALEDGARAAGYRVLRLETGPAQPEAYALYAARGYRTIPFYGSYPEAAAFELVLTDEA